MSTARLDTARPVTIAYVQEIFRSLVSGDGKEFFDHVAEDVDWIVEGTHPLAGHYRSKSDFLAHTFEKLDKVLPQHNSQTRGLLASGNAWRSASRQSL
jgi:uncharacterized protein